MTNIDHRLLLDNCILLAKCTRIFDVPTLLSTTESRTFGGYLWPQIQAVLPCVAAIERSLIRPWDEERFVQAVENTARKVLILAGLWTATSVAFTAAQALDDGYDVYVVEDCCGDVSAVAHASAVDRMVQTGVKTTTALALMLQWQRDWSERATYDAVMDLMRIHGGATGFGLEYAYTMVHRATPLQPVPYVVPGPADTLS